MKLTTKTILAVACATLPCTVWGQITVPVNSAGNILDATATSFYFTVPSIGAVADIDVRVAIDHQDVWDLSARLYSPGDARYVDLWQALVTSSPIGGPLATQIKDTLLDDEAVGNGPIGTSFTIPPTDTGNAESAAPWDDPDGYQPQGYGQPLLHVALSEFDGVDAGGLWRLEIRDQASTSTGYLYAPGDTASWGETTGTQLIITVPEASDFALVAGMGLLGFAACRRMRSR